jgi:putative ABC transport system substrate-binding protein
MRFNQLGRRQFITLLGGTVAAWPLAVRAQQAIRRVAVVLGFAQDDQQGQIRLAAFVETLLRLGWNDGRNVRLDIHWAGGNMAYYKAIAAEVAAASPDVVVAMTNPFVAQLQPLTKTIPIVFTQVSNSVGAGFVSNIAHPGGNITGFENFLGDIGSKWLGLLKEAAPAVTRVGIVLDPDNSSLAALRKAIEEAAPRLGVQTAALSVHAAADIDNAINGFAQQPNSGLIVLANPVTIRNRDLIIMLAARHRLPAVYMFRYFATSGGFIAYGIDQLAQWRGAAGYVDRILNGEKPGDLPVQAPTKYELIVNLKTARVLGLTVPQTLLARADEVIE